MKIKEKQEKKFRRQKRVRSKIFGTAQRPRLSVFRSSKHIYAQLIDDEKGVTVVAANDLELMPGSSQKRRKKEREILSGKIITAFEVGKLLAKKALEKKIEKVVFDRGGYQYHGRVKALAEGGRAGGLKF